MLTASALRLRELPPRLYWIYGLVDPRNDEIRYVGQSLEVHSRGEHHKRSLEQSVKRAWVEELRVLNLKPRVMLFESAETLDIANHAETYWINHCRERGANLLNGLMRDWRNPANLKPNWKHRECEGLRKMARLIITAFVCGIVAGWLLHFIALAVWVKVNTNEFEPPWPNDPRVTRYGGKGR